MIKVGENGIFLSDAKAAEILLDMQAATAANDALKNAKIINGKTQILE